MSEEKKTVNQEENEQAVEKEAVDTAEAAEETTEAAGADAAEGEEKEKTSWAEKKAAKKAAKVDKEKEALKEQVAMLDDKVKRQLAEFENFRNRTDREKQMQFSMGAKSVLEKMLPIIDNFERGFQTVPEDQMSDPFVDGMSRVYKQLLTELENIGVKPIEAVGQPFDPNFHNAVMQTESEELESGTVAQEFQKGYIYNDTVIRHSMVSVVS